MTAHIPEPILADAMEAYKATPEFIEWRAGLVAERLGVIVYRFDKIDHATTVAMLAALLDDLGAGSPSVPLLMDRVRDDAQFWAECATPIEVEAYTAAGLQAISRGAFCIAARKRLLIALWNSMTPADKRSFMSHAGKPGGAA